MNKQIDQGEQVEKHENVMLLAMSTLPAQPKVNTYQICRENEKLYFKSLSQMEPHTKYVLYTLAANGEKLDRIVILESMKARSEKPERWNGETATTLYIKRIKNYLGSHEAVPIEVADELDNINETPCDSHIYINGYPEIIKVDLENPIFFWNAVQAILGADHEKNVNVNLYMDMQGGDRNSISQMNAIAELLVRQKVVVCGRYANDFDPRRYPPLHTIRDASKEYRTYDLISAMDIFSRYGWGDKLEEYFQGMGTGDSKESRLIAAIKDASYAISRCSVDKFDSAVRRIEGLEKDFAKPEAVTEMDVVYQDIKNDYEPLFSPKYRYVAQIRWCFERHFLQQALTILEAKMPYEFVHSGLIYYMTKDGDRQKFLDQCENIYKEIQKFNRYKMKDLNHYMIKDYCRQNHNMFQDPMNLLHFGLDGPLQKKTISLLQQYWYLSNLRNQVNHASAGEHNPEGFFCYMKKKYKKDRNWKDGKEVDYEAEIRRFLKEWESLAEKVPKKIREKVIDLS